MSFQATQIAAIIHRIDCRHSPTELQNLIEHFSLQLMHQKIEISPGSFFVIRLTNFVAVRALMSYLEYGFHFELNFRCFHQFQHILCSWLNSISIERMLHALNDFDCLISCRAWLIFFVTSSRDIHPEICS